MDQLFPIIRRVRRPLVPVEGTCVSADTPVPEQKAVPAEPLKPELTKETPVAEEQE